LGLREFGPQWEVSMSDLIEILRDEHRNIERLLLVLERELDVFARLEQPDYEVVQAVIGHFNEYPDRCHHPKEDMVYNRLKARATRLSPTSSAISKQIIDRAPSACAA
jgi:hemerythrin-like domain-containing protein